MLIIASEGGTVTNGDATLTFAPGSLPSDAYVRIVPAADSAYDLQAFDAATGAEIHEFLLSPVLTIAGARNLPVAPSIYYHSPDGGLERIASTYDAATGNVTAALPHFSIFSSVINGTVWEIELTDEVAQSVLLSVVGTDLVVTVIDVDNPGVVDSRTMAIGSFTSVSITGGNGVDVLLVASLPPGVTVSFDGNGGAFNAAINATDVALSVTDAESIELGEYLDIDAQFGFQFDTDVSFTTAGGESVTGAKLLALSITSGKAFLGAGGIGFDTTITSLNVGFLWDATRTWVAASGTIGGAFEGIDGLTLSAGSLTVAYNGTASDLSAANWSTLDLEPGTGADPLGAFGETGAVTRVTGDDATVDLFGFVTATADFTYESREADVDLDGGGLGAGDLDDAALLLLSISNLIGSIGVGAVRFSATGGSLAVASIKPAGTGDDPLLDRGRRIADRRGLRGHPGLLARRVERVVEAQPGRRRGRCRARLADRRSASATPARSATTSWPARRRSSSRTSSSAPRARRP